MNSYDWSLVPLEAIWQMVLIKLLSGVTGWNYDIILNSESTLRSVCVIIHISWRSSMITNHGSDGWKWLIYCTINFSSLWIAWGDNRQHRSSFNPSHRRYLHLWLQLFAVCCFSIPLETRLWLCFPKMTMEVYFVLPLWWIVILQNQLHSSITHGGLLYTPPPPMVLLHYIRCSSIPVGASHAGLALQYFIQHFIQPSLSAMLV